MFAACSSTWETDPWIRPQSLFASESSCCWLGSLWEQQRQTDVCCALHSRDTREHATRCGCQRTCSANVMLCTHCICTMLVKNRVVFCHWQFVLWLPLCFVKLTTMAVFFSYLCVVCVAASRVSRNVKLRPLRPISSPRRKWRHLAAGQPSIEHTQFDLFSPFNNVLVLCPVRKMENEKHKNCNGRTIYARKNTSKMDAAVYLNFAMKFKSRSRALTCR